MRPHHHYKVAKQLTHLLDNQFKILGFRFGLDPIVGAFPWIGDAITAALALYIVYIAKQAKIEQKHINRMIANVAIDFIIGVIPVVGFVGDFFFKASSRNLEILEKYGKFEAVDGEIIEMSLQPSA